VKVLVFIEHDIVVRHFIHSGVFRLLAAKHDVLFVFPEEGHKRVTTDIPSLDLGAPFIRLAVDQDRRKLWKRLFQVNHLRWRRGRQQAVMRKFYWHALGWKVALMYSLLGFPGVYQIYKRHIMATMAARPYEGLEALIAEQRPDVIVHPSVLEGEYINDLVDACQRHDIPLTVIMNSWDNPSTKSAIIGNPDWFLVWGPQTKQHAIEYMGLAPAQIIEFGAAQFDVYRAAPRMDRAEFCSIHDIEPGAKILLYAGSSKETDEFSHLVAIDDAIEAGRLGHVVAVYRPHPWGNGGRGGDRIAGHAWRHVRIESTMRAYLDGVSAGQSGITIPDYRHTHDVLASVDALVSPLSTIILEAALHGKPVLCFLPTDDGSADHFQMTLPLIHFEDMFRASEVHTAHGTETLIPALADLLAHIDDADFRARLAVTAEHFVRSFERPYGERIMEFLEATGRDATA
jgi:hypothetical protein